MAQSLIRGSTQILDGTVTSAKLAGGIALSQITGGTNLIQADGSVAFTANQSMGGFTLTALADAVNPQDAVNLRTAQALINGVAIKEYDVVATANLALSGLLTIDGVTLTDGQTALLTGQTTASQNGPWVAHSGSWTRPTNWAAASTQQATLFLIGKGSTNHDTKWLLITDDLVVDTTAATISQDSSGVSYTNGNGLSLTGNVFAVKLAAAGGITFDGSQQLQIPANGSSINVSGSGIKVADSASGGQVMIGGSANVATFTTLSGDISTITTAGVVTLATTIGKPATNYVVNEVPSGTVNGSNATFTMAAAPLAGKEQLYLNGVKQFPGAGNDYTISGATITMLNIPQSTGTPDRLTVDYWK